MWELLHSHAPKLLIIAQHPSLHHSRKLPHHKIFIFSSCARVKKSKSQVTCICISFSRLISGALKRHAYGFTWHSLFSQNIRRWHAGDKGAFFVVSPTPPRCVVPILQPERDKNTRDPDEKISSYFFHTLQVFVFSSLSWATAWKMHCLEGRFMSEGAACRYLWAASIIDDLPAADARGIIIYCMEGCARGDKRVRCWWSRLGGRQLLSSSSPTNSLPDH